MEEVQKNENGTTVPQADGKPKKEDKPKRELTPQQVQQRRKMIVFPLMFLAFAGCMYLIFAPSGKEDVNVESVGGFNADIPLPAEDGIIADKQKAYEQAVISRKQQDKIQSLQDFGFTNHKRKSTCCRKKIRSHKGAAVLLQGRLTGTSTAS